MEKTMVLAKTAEKPNYESEILRIIRGNTSPKAMLNQLEDYHGSDIADVIEQLSEQERKKVFRICPAEMLAEAFAHLEEEKAGECLKEISPQLSRTFKKEKDDNREYYEAQRISEEILRQNALPRKDHSQRVIEIMQEKIKFFKENSGKISMEYNAISGNLVLTDGESQKEYQRDNLEFDLYGAYDISEEDIQRVKDSLDSVTSENKEISMKEVKGRCVI